MAIDQEISRRVDAYRGNPQALQQRYAGNQELLDLLALQRLKSEKDGALRKVQMEMQQNPQTIRQQTERQLLDMTKQELSSQTAGIMQNAQKNQQKNMQRVAKQGAANPEQMQRMQAGLGALAQRQQQGQAPVRMAEGGKVTSGKWKGMPLGIPLSGDIGQLVTGMGFELGDWDVYRREMARIESTGEYGDPGGANKHYDGRYQLGRKAKKDAAAQLGETAPAHKAADREAYRNNPEMQERYFAAFTKANHNYLMKENPEYAEASPRRKLQILGYAHNQGMGGADTWLTKGIVGADANKIKGTKYSEAIADAFDKEENLNDLERMRRSGKFNLGAGSIGESPVNPNEGLTPLPPPGRSDEQEENFNDLERMRRSGKFNLQAGSIGEPPVNPNEGLTSLSQQQKNLRNLDRMKLMGKFNLQAGSIGEPPVNPTKGITSLSQQEKNLSNLERMKQMGLFDPTVGSIGEPPVNPNEGLTPLPLPEPGDFSPQQIRLMQEQDIRRATSNRPAGYKPLVRNQFGGTDPNRIDPIGEPPPLEVSSLPVPNAATPATPPEATTTTPGATTTTPGVGLASLTEPQVAAPTLNIPNVEAQLEKMKASTNMRSLDPDAEAIAARNDAAKYLGRDAKAAQMNEYLAQLKAMDVRQQDPEKLREERISAFLRGTAGTAGFGSTMAAGSKGMADERVTQETSERARLASRIGIAKSTMDMDLDIGKTAQTSADKAFTNAQANNRTLLQVAQGLTVSRQNMAIAKADNLLKARQYSVTNTLAQKLFDFDVKKANAKTVADQAEVLEKRRQFKAEYMFKVVNADPDVLSIKKLLLAGQTNEANRAKLKEAIDFAWLVGATTLAKIQAESKVNAAVQRNKGG